MKLLQCHKIDFHKSNKSAERMISHYWYFKDTGFTYQPYVCNKCHDLSMFVRDLKDLTILKIKGVDYRCYVFNMSKKEAIKLVNNSKLGNKGVLQWILVQIKQLLKQLKKVHLEELILDTFFLVLMVSGIKNNGKNLMF